MATELDIANGILAECGGDEIITDLDSTTQAEAKKIKPALTRAIPYIATIWDWPVARSRQLKVADPSFDGDSRYGFRFTAPSDGAWRYEMEDGTLLTDFELEDGFVYTNVENTYFRLIDTDALDVTTWPPLLVRVLTLFVATRVCISLSASEGDRQRLDQEYDRELRRAKTHFSRKGPPQTYMSDAQSQFIGAHQGNGII